MTRYVQVRGTATQATIEEFAQVARKAGRVVTIPALSLTQPWASLVGCGAKKIETRSWGTRYRGPLAIHAAKGFPAWARECCYDRAIRSALEFQGGVEVPELLPLGVVLATCVLLDCIGITASTPLPEEPERSFGDYTLGRYMWVLLDIQRLPDPIPARGALGLWSWTRTEVPV